MDKDMNTTDTKKAWFERLRSAALAPHTDVLTPIADDGDIALVVFEPDFSDESTRENVALLTGLKGDALRALGKGAYTFIDRVTQERAATIFSPEVGMDAASIRWATGKRNHPRLFVWSGVGFTLINHTEAKGWHAVEEAAAN